MSNQPIQDQDYAPQQGWAQTDAELPPPRPRRRLLTPVPVALVAALTCACGFIGGVLVEKGQASPSGSAEGAGLASRLGRLTGAANTGAAALAGGARGAGATAGEVTFVQGNTLYVLDTNGNTIKVHAGPGVNVTKTVPGTVRGIDPGETVVVTGGAGADGAVSAESIRVGGNVGGALGALLGSGASSHGGGGSGGGQALFGGG
jgi:hypothetical protein